MLNDEIELAHAKSFTDVVFGVLIALPLTEVLPRLVADLVTKRSLSSGESLLLLSASLVFSTFYWLEVRRFIDKQNRFHNALGIGGLSFGRLMASLIMAALVAAILKFANIRTLRAFLEANLLFWLIDLFGNIALKRKYKKLNIEAIKTEYEEEHKWYLDNFHKWYKGPFYSGISVVFFSIALGIAYIFRNGVNYQFVIASLIFAFTLIRHLGLRRKL
jgi:hypothetical protein